MPDTTWSVRMDEETKAEVVTLLNSSGEQGKEFIQSLMNAYKLKKAEELQPAAAQDIKDLQIHLGRIQDIYYNLSKRIDTRIRAKDDEVKETLIKKDEEIGISTVRVAELSEEVNKLTDLLTGCNNVIDSSTKKINELEEANSTTKALVNEYKDKNDTLAGLLAEYKAYKAEIEEIKVILSSEKEARIAAEKGKQDAEDLAERIKSQHQEDLGRLTSKYEEDITRIKAKDLDDMGRLTAKIAEDIERLKSQHVDSLSRMKESLTIDHKQALLELQEKHQTEINKLHHEYNEQIQEIIFAFSKGEVEDEK